MKTRIIKVTFVAVIAMVSAINAFNANKNEAVSDAVLANVEALASDSEGGLEWRGYALDSKNSCCKYMGHPDIYCSGSFKQCK